MEIKVEGCGPLYQWDVGRRVFIDGLDPGSEVHFSLKGADRAYVVEPDGEHAPIPNQLLSDGRDVIAYAVCGGQTVASATLMVRRRARPDDYAYEQTEVAVVATQKWVLEQIEGLGCAGFEIATDDEIREAIGVDADA